MNFALEEAPKTVPPRIRPAKAQVPEPGDWTCPHCGDFQFARNVACRSCGGPRPPPASRPKVTQSTATRVAHVARNMGANGVGAHGLGATGDRQVIACGLDLVKQKLALSWQVHPNVCFPVLETFKSKGS